MSRPALVTSVVLCSGRQWRVSPTGSSSFSALRRFLASPKKRRCDVSRLPVPSIMSVAHSSGLVLWSRLLRSTTRALSVRPHALADRGVFPARVNLTASSLLNKWRSVVLYSDQLRGPGSSALSVSWLVSLLRQENAMDICVVQTPKQLQYAEFLVLASGSSSRHLKAMALCAVRECKFLKQESNPHARIEGLHAEDWIGIDFGSIVVHLMLPETRKVYELEKLWTLRAYDEQLRNIPPETFPVDFIYDIESK